MRTGGIHPAAGTDGPWRRALCHAEVVNISLKAQGKLWQGHHVTPNEPHGEQTQPGQLFSWRKNCRWFTACVNKIIYNLAILFVERKDGFKSSSDWVPDHLQDRNLVWTQLSFPTTLGITKDMEAPPFGQRSIQEEHRSELSHQQYPTVSAADHSFTLLLETYGLFWLSSGEMRARSGHSDQMRKLTLQI